MKLTETEWQLLLTGITLVSLGVLLWIINGAISRILKRSEFSRQRRKVAVRAMRFITTLVAAIITFVIWGVEQESVLVVASSLLTILGVAFFAQWSLLSNITSGLILYFNNPMKIGSKIQLLDKDFPIEGTVDDITMFFVQIKKEDGTLITLPTNVFMQKAISVQD